MLAGCGRGVDREKKPVPDTFKVKFETTKGDFVIEVTKAWAPLGAERFHQLVTSGFYDNSKFFRVVPGFVVQFGLAATPELNQGAPGEIPDDPVKQSNVKGTITFATRGPNSRTTQVFINLNDNRGLDRQGFSPFGTVTEGMGVVEQLYSGYGDSGPDQGRIKSMGNGYVESSFPKLDGIKQASVL
ncbi:MAG: peptidylprolyl isomerase [Bryobacterales bacterium]|nr:peptidylprolyl isomerase [Bryobacterales bacterium]